MNIVIRNETVHPFISVKNENQTSYNLENDVVRCFMKNERYPDGYGSGSGASLIRPYEKFVNENDVASWTEKTRPVILFGDGTKVILTNNGKSVTYTMKDKYVKIYNLIPRQKYTWNMYNGSKKIKSGSFRTEGTVRMIDLGEGVNCRDIGGYPCEGGYVAYNKVIRGANIDSATYNSASAVALRTMGITAEIDLRLKNKKYTQPNLGLKYYGTMYNSSKAVTYDNYGLVTGYASILTNPKNIKNCLEAIATEAENGGGVFFHCYAGADRTGTLATLILLMLGVSEENAIKDWEMTSFSCWYNFKRIDTERWDEYPKGEMRGFYKALKSYSGNTLQEKVTNWLKNKASVSQSLIDRLKKVLVVKS